MNPIVELLFGLSRPLFLREDVWPVVFLLAATTWFLASRQISWHRLRKALPLLLLCPFVIGSALIVHFLLEPSFNDRNLIILAPVLWLLLPNAIASVNPTNLNRGIVATGVALVCLNHALHSDWLVRGFKSEWRDSAAFIEGYHAECQGSPIPVLRHLDAERDEYFYGYYLEHDFEFRYVDDYEELEKVLLDESGQECPIRFWAPHGLTADALTSRYRLSDMGYKIVTFPHAAPWSDVDHSGALVLVDASATPLSRAIR